MKKLNSLKYQNEWFATVILVIFLMLTGNNTLIHHIIDSYPTQYHMGFVISLILFFSLLTAMFITLISIGRFGKYWIALMLIIAAQSAYYMDQYGIIIDSVMIDNVVKTDRHEVAGLINMVMLVRVSLLGLLPAWLVVRYWPESRQNFWQTLSKKLTGLLMMVLLLVSIAWPFSASYASFIREHKMIRSYANPTYPIYSVIKYCSQYFSEPVINGPLENSAPDAKILPAGADKHELIIMVVGETARYDRFALNGYSRNTNPRLARESVVSFSHVSACGTSTSVSLPCMFSVLNRKFYNKQKALSMKNALDVLADNGVAVLWRDNNSNSKGVADHIEYEDYKDSSKNTVCDIECRDIGMLTGLENYVLAHKNQDILVVLHQMGNHGPEYYRRYPEAFRQFKPTCDTGELSECTQNMIDNSYDNAILYTDYFLAEVINKLKKYDQHYETAMLYVSDHGESLGERGIYLHAAPYQFAPESQTHVPALIWLGENFDYKRNQLLPYRDYPLSHDDLFCTLLIAFEVDTHTCDSKHAMLMQNIDFLPHE